MKEIEIKYGVGSFVCYECHGHYTIAEKSKIMIMDEEGNNQSVCKFCVKKLGPEDYDRLIHPTLGVCFTRRSKANKILYKIKKKLGIEY